MTKRIISLALALVLTFAVCATTVFAAYDLSKFTKKLEKTYEVASGVTLKQYSVTSGKLNTSDYHNVNMLTFGSGEYVPLVYSSWAGGSGRLEAQYNKATQEGYEVVAVVNGSFFSMGDPYGYLNGTDISDGKILSAHAGYNHEVLAFLSDGTAKVVTSNLKYSVNINGNDIPNSLGSVNKRGKADGSWNNQFYYFDQCCGPIDSAKTDTVEKCPGYEVVCDKLDGTEMTVGGTLKGKVVEVRKNSYASSIGRNQFVLFCKNDSPLAANVKDLKAGDTIDISVTEANDSARETMEKASSVIENVGWLVKDGVDMTEKESTIGSHGVEYEAAWTAVGIKPNGEYVLFISDIDSKKDSLVMKDVAKLLIAEGCTNVIRMDGGGSVAMYVSKNENGNAGYVYNQGRAVADCIMIVKRSSMQSKKPALETAVANAEKLLKSDNIPVLKNAVDNAKKALNNKLSTNTDYLSALDQVLKATNGCSELNEYMKKCESLNKKNYSQYALDAIRVAYAKAESVKKNSASTANDYANAANALKAAYTGSGKLDAKVSLGTKYTTSIAANPSYPDTGSKELTNGEVASPANAGDPAWVGFSGANTVSVTVDLGKKYENISGASVNALALKSWGIGMPNSITVSVSDDGKTFKEAGKIGADKNVLGEGVAADYVLSGIKASGRYVKFEMAQSSSFIFISEVEVTASFDTIKYEMGDINGDGKISAADYVLARRGAKNTTKLADDVMARVDLDRDGSYGKGDWDLFKQSCIYHNVNLW